MKSRCVTLAVALAASCAKEESTSRADAQLDANTTSDGRSTADHFLVGDMDPSTCYAGAAFLDCPGPRAPALYCSWEGCKWVSHGTAIGGFTFKAREDCTCDPPCVGELWATLMSFFLARGTDPWTRERERNVTVSVGGTPQKSEHSITCTDCPACSLGASPCMVERLPLRASRELPGTYVVTLFAEGGFGGWMLEVEIDLRQQTQPAGRVCRVPFTDAPQCNGEEEIVCAKSGTIKLSSSPSAEKMNVALSVSVDFADDSHIDAFIADN